jgi:hypothetical protein
VKVKTVIAATLTALAVAVPASASVPGAPDAYLPNGCGRPFTGMWYSTQTGHTWIGMWTGTDVARGGPTDGVYRLYAYAYTAGGYDAWHFSYYAWQSCYY